MAAEDFGSLVTADWLTDHLTDPDIRILETTVHLHPLSGGDMRAESGRPDYERGHIPGAAFADLIGDLSDAASTLRFTLPSPDRFAAAMGALGVGNGDRVVLYNRGSPGWSARLWWMLRAFGFENAAVLDGGFEAWTGQGLPISTEPATYHLTHFSAGFRPGLFVGRERVAAALDEPNTLVVNALTAEQHSGAGGPHYGRPGRIPGSANVPARDLVDPETHRYRPLDDLRRTFGDIGAFDADEVIVYCGGGIAASADAFVLHRLGKEAVAVYDASLQEWAADPELPMETS